jgi:putative endonuclease
VPGRPDRRRATGAAGEDQAAGWYLAHGYQVLARNWRSRQGEIDLVAARGNTLVFCEVKARTGSRFGEPFEAVTRAKQLRLRRLAAEWLRSAPRGRAYDIRFDVVSIRGDELNVIEAAF